MMFNFFLWLLDYPIVFLRLTGGYTALHHAWQTTAHAKAKGKTERNCAENSGDSTSDRLPSSQRRACSDGNPMRALSVSESMTSKARRIMGESRFESRLGFSARYLNCEVT